MQQCGSWRHPLERTPSSHLPNPAPALGLALGNGGCVSIRPVFWRAGKIEGLHYATMDSEAPAQLAAFIFAASGSKLASVPGIGSGVRCAPQAKRVRTPTASCGWKCSDPKAESGFPLQQKEVACWGVCLALLCPQNHEHMLFGIQCCLICSTTLFQHVVHAKWGKGSRWLKLRD